MIRYHLFVYILAATISNTFSQQSKADSLLATATEIAEDILYQDQDTNYIKSYAERISIKILANNKFNTFRLWDQSLNSSIRYRPDLGVNFGIGAAYKWFALDISTSLGFSEDHISNSIYRDIQGRVLTSKHYLRIRYQYYYGYKMDYISGDEADLLDEYETRLDMRTLQFGVQYLYCFNYGKFSLKAPFVMNERQKKSAGSFVAGAGMYMYVLDADSALIPGELALLPVNRNSFSELNVVSSTANFGYMYSIVIKGRFFITLGLIPGMGIKNGDYRVGNRVLINSALSLSFKTMNAIGYNGMRIFGGLQLISNYYFMPLEKNLRSSVLEGRSSLYFGYRF
jgi:hypothetical protein